jgi:hypothetical protein
MDWNNPAERNALVRTARSTGDVLKGMRETLAAYHRAGDDWRRANAETDDAPGVREATRYSEALESCAHDFALQVDALLRNLSIDVPTPAPVEPLGGPHPGVNGHLPEHAQ